MDQSKVPDIRIEPVTTAPARATGRYVLYWMTAARRTGWSFALQRAVEWCGQLGKPLIVLDTLLCGAPWANDRLHHFALDGMADIAPRFDKAGVLYYPHVETRPGDVVELVRALAATASVLVVDNFPDRFLGGVIEQALANAPILVEEVDSNGLLPLRAAPRVFGTAFAFRRFLQKELPRHLVACPVADPLRGKSLAPRPRLSSVITKRWPKTSRKLLNGSPAELAKLPIDHVVAPVELRGGPTAARKALRRFVAKHLDSYAERRNHPDDAATSGLSPYLHAGHISAHETLAAIAGHESWSPNRLRAKATGGRAGWWRMSATAEAFLDQLVTWRELGYNMAHLEPGYDRYDSLPDWAKRTLAGHAGDERPYAYTLDQLAAARTHDALWNAAQMQLVRDGMLHNYLRMLWGKKIIEWTRSPEEALTVMVALNNTYALDGRNPNSYSGIFWCLGRYDRPWGPTRPIFGTVRYMSSENTRRKVRCRQ
ncbi:MAG: deoxyribodipyrimidine photolyase, partial [Verrucomicrobia bacterium]|nr:deoxyribodipyrimidine photolyase [Verrucomicrobiota bacterium]